MYKTIEPSLSNAQLQLYLIWSFYTLNLHKKRLKLILIQSKLF